MTLCLPGKDSYLVLGQDGPIIKTPLGNIQGYYKKSFENRTYAAFEGIPYAKPPIGDLRFVVSFLRKLAVSSFIVLPNFLALSIFTALEV